MLKRLKGLLAKGLFISSQTGTSYTILASDTGKLLTFSNASAIAVSLPAATTVGFGVGPDGAFEVHVMNRGVGTLTITPSTSTLDGAATLVLQQGQGVRIVSDGANYFTARGFAGVAPVKAGGTGFSAYTPGDLLYASDANTLSRLSPGTNTYVLTLVAGMPAWQPAASGGSSASTLTVGTTAISSGTDGRVLYDNAGTLSELATTGSGSVVRAQSPTLVSPNLGTPASGILTNCTGLPLDTGTTGSVPVNKGGTGQTSFSAGYLKANGTSGFTTVSSIPASDISGSVPSATFATTAGSANSANTANSATTASSANTANSASTATTATNLSGGTSSSSSSSSGSYTVSGGIFGFGNQSTGTYGASGSTVGWMISGTTLVSCSFGSFNLGSNIGGAYCYFGTAWTNISDERTKKDVADYTLGLDAILELRPVSFYYNGLNDTPDDGVQRVGFIAQEVQETALSAMVRQVEGSDFLHVNTNDLIFALVNAVKTLSARVSALEEA